MIEFVSATPLPLKRNNRFSATADAELRRTGPVILIERSFGVALLDNIVSDLRRGTTAAIEIGASVTSGDSGVRVSGPKASLAAEAPQIIDRRTMP